MHVYSFLFPSYMQYFFCLNASQLSHPQQKMPFKQIRRRTCMNQHNTTIQLNLYNSPKLRPYYTSLKRNFSYCSCAYNVWHQCGEIWTLWPLYLRFYWSSGHDCFTTELIHITSTRSHFSRNFPICFYFFHSLDPVIKLEWPISQVPVKLERCSFYHSWHLITL